MSVAQDTTSIDLASERDFSLGSIRVKPSSREIVHEDALEVLEPRVMQTLVALSRRSGQVVSRDQLIEECWAGRVVGEDAIQRVIARIRRIAESYGGFSIDTIARVGYRLNVKPLPEAATPPLTQIETATAKSDMPRLAWASVALLVIVATVGAWWGISRWSSAKSQQARLEETLTAINDLIAKDNYGAAFTAGYPLSQDVNTRSDTRFKAAWEKIVTPIRPLVAEAGAKVYFKSYEDVDGEWIFAGVSPITEWIEAPRATLRIKIEKTGFRTGYFAVAVPGPSIETEKRLVFVHIPIEMIPLPLVAETAVPDDMVVVPRTNVPVYLTGWTPDLFGGQQFDIPAFAIARAEVSNREFKEFVDAGGYVDDRWWEGLDFKLFGRRLNWNEARERFVDTTHRPGPAGWQLSTYPRGQADLPVSGISWYEAVAYARFRGKQLPTIHHWMRAAFPPLTAMYPAAPAIAVSSRFMAETPISAQSEIGLGPWGTYQMLGNIREWVTNHAGNDAIALGGAWSDVPYDSILTYTADPMMRAPAHGFRLMQELPGAPIPDTLFKSVQLVRDTGQYKREPVSDEAFEAMRFQFNKAKIEPLEVFKQEVHRSNLLSVEEVILRFANEEPTTLYIVRPTPKQDHPLQTIIYGPGGNCCYARRPNRDTLENLREIDFIPNGGRIIVMPIWKGSYDRTAPMPLDRNANSDRWRRAALAWHHDLTTTLDYLEKLPEVDATKFGYIGYSGGAIYNSLVLAIDPRFKAGVYVSGGVLSSPPHPMADIVNYAPRIKIPLLMINGRYDHNHPLATSQKRLFTLLGTPVDKKNHIVYDTGHFGLRGNAVITDVSNWFDRYLGPAR